MTIQIKATEQFFFVVLFIMLYKVVLTFESVDEILKLIIQITVPEHHFSVVLFITYAVRVGLVKIPKCGHSNGSYSEEDFPVVRFIGLSKWFYLLSLGTRL